MEYTQRTYALPADALLKFEQAVGPEQRSQIVAFLIQEWLVDRERHALRQALAEGLADMAGVYRDIEQEFNAADEELHRAVDY